MTPYINIITIIAIVLSGVLSPAIDQINSLVSAPLNDGLLQSDIEPTPTPTSPGIESGYPPPGGEATPTPQISPTATPTAPEPIQITPTPTTLPPETTPTETGEEPVTLELISRELIFLKDQPVQLEWKIGGSIDAKDFGLYQVVLKNNAAALPSEDLSEFSDGSEIRIALDQAPPILAWQVSPEFSGPVNFYATLELEGKPVSQTAITVYTGGIAVESGIDQSVYSRDGKVTLQIPEKALPADAVFSISRPAEKNAPLYSYTGLPIEIIAVTQQDQKPIKEFAEAISIQVSYDEEHIFGWNEENLYLYYYDQPKNSWHALPSTVDTKNNIISAKSEHLTVFDFNINAWQANMMPSVEDFQVAGFTGAATYQFPIWTPPGPGGLQPALTLNYNSQAVDEATVFTQPSWVGLGWSLDLGSISRNMHATEDYTADDTFFISTGGISGLLLPIVDNTVQTIYNTAEQSFTRVIYDKTAQTWTAWSTEGTRYEFNWQTKTRGNDACTDSAGENNLIWQWSLSSITDIFGNQLTYNYQNEVKSQTCHNETAVYPTTIEYQSNDRYQIEFVREERQDYMASWDETEQKTLFGTERLQKILIKYDNGSEWDLIRVYELHYLDEDTTNNNQLYPGFTWDGGGYTSGLWKIVESSGDQSITLPATTFSYSTAHPHLTKIENGYGGSVEIEYERWAYFDDTNKDIRSFMQNFGEDRQECDGVYGTSWTKQVPDDIVQCNTGGLQIGEDGNPSMAYHEFPVSLIKPGSSYRFYIRAAGFEKTSSVEYGFARQVNFSRVRIVAIDDIPENVYKQKDETGLMPYGYNPNKDSITLYIECDSCLVDIQEAVLFPEYYRVTQKSVQDETTGETYLYKFNYDNPTPNTKFVSEAVINKDSTHPLYFHEMREYRGNAQTIVTTPPNEENEALTTITWYHQDDALKGKPYHTLAAQLDYFEDFNNSAENLETYWIKPDSRITSVYYEDFDNSLYSFTLNSNFSSEIRRNGNSLSENEFSLFHFRLNEVTNEKVENSEELIDPAGDPAATLGLSNGSQYFNFWIEADANHNYSLWLCTTNTDCSSSGALILDDTFLEDHWYAAMFMIDPGGVLKFRLWELDQPENAAEGQLSGYTPAGSWYYNHKIRTGALYLDSYMEGKLFQETETNYQSSTLYDMDPANGIPDLAGLNEDYVDLNIIWSVPTDVTSKTYEGSNQWIGSRTRYSYNSATLYGNLESRIEESWTGSAWQGYRGTSYQYYPLAAVDTYLVSLTAAQEDFQCDTADCNSRTISAAAQYIYDTNTTYAAAPVDGKLTWTRMLLENDPLNLYQDTRYEYVDYGNLIHTIQYRDAGTESTPATLDPVHTWRCYGSANQPSGCEDDGFYTYLRWERNDLGQQTGWTYDPHFGVPLSETTANNAVTYAQYDALGRIITLIRPGDNSLSPTLAFGYYDETPFRSSATQKTGAGQVSTIRKIYDGLGRLIQQQQADQQLADGSYDVLVDYVYDFSGNLVSEHMPEKVNPYSTGSMYRPLTGGSVTVSTYDLLGRVETITAADNSGSSTQYSLDISNQELLTQVTNSLNQVTIYKNDIFGRNTEVIPASGPGVVYDYDTADLLVQAAYGTAVTSLDYDLAGRKMNMDDADMGAWAYQYDALGNLTQQTDAEGNIVCLYYDHLSRLEGKYYSSSTCPTIPTSYDVSFGYDANSTFNSGIGYRTSMNDISGSTAWEYDLRGRLIHETKSIRDPIGDDPLGTYHTYYAYRSDDQLKQIVLPNGEALDFDYHTQGVLNAISSDHWDAGSITEVEYLKETQYDEAGRVVERTMGNDVVQTYDYNPWTTQGGRLDTFTTGASIDPLLTIDYGYDALGNISGLIYNSDNLTESRVYSYDELNRLRTVTIGGLLTESVSYDPDNGNIDYKDGVEYGYDSSHPHAVKELDSVEKYLYDANGSMTSRNVDGTTYAMDYDPENRLTSISGGTLTTRYVFDGDGRRVLSVVGDTRTLYVNEYFEVTMENDAKVNQDLTIVPVDICENRYCFFMPLMLNQSEALGMSSGNFGTSTLIPQGMQPDNAYVTWRVYYMGGALRVQTITGDVLSYLVQDHLNSTALTLNSSGSVTGEMIYSSFGETRATYGTTPTKKLYTGQYEAEVGLYFYNARWYDNQLGRFIQADSIIPEPGSPQSWDRYAYGNNDPIKNTDPSGHYIIEGDWQDPNSGTYSAGYNQHGNTILLSPNSSKNIYGVGMPIRVSYATLIDPNNEFGIYAAGIVLGMSDAGKSMPPGSLGARVINPIPRNLVNDVFPEPFSGFGSSGNFAQQYIQKLENGNPRAHAWSKHGPNSPDADLILSASNSKYAQTRFVNEHEMISAINKTLNANLADINNLASRGEIGTKSFNGPSVNYNGFQQKSGTIIPISGIGTTRVVIWYVGNGIWGLYTAYPLP